MRWTDIIDVFMCRHAICCTKLLKTQNAADLTTLFGTGFKYIISVSVLVCITMCPYVSTRACIAWMWITSKRSHAKLCKVIAKKEPRWLGEELT